MESGKNVDLLFQLRQLGELHVVGWSTPPVERESEVPTELEKKGGGW